jgi:hypothetical protein
MHWRVESAEIDRSVFSKQQKNYYDSLLSVSKAFPRVYLVDTSAAVCTEKQCSLAKDLVLMYRERNHLTIEGSRLVAAQILKQIPDTALLKERARAQ